MSRQLIKVADRNGYDSDSETVRLRSRCQCILWLRRLFFIVKNQLISSDSIHSICIRRYNQNSREGGKLANDGQQSVPLCSTSDVQLRFLCPDDLEEVFYRCGHFRQKSITESLHRKYFSRFEHCVKIGFRSTTRWCGTKK